MTDRKTSSILLATSILLGVLAMLAPAGAQTPAAQTPAAQTPAAQSTAALASFEGRWEWTALESERQGQFHAIDQVCDQLNVFMRELARGEIRRRVPPDRAVRFQVESERMLRMWIDSWSAQVPLDGTHRDQPGPGGERTRISGTFSEGRIVEHQVGEQGRRTNTFMLDQNGARLTMWVRIGSSQLPSDIQYPLTYRRPR